MPLGHPADQEFTLESDGTTLFHGPTLGLTQATPEVLANICDWNSGSGIYQNQGLTRQYALFFPELRAIQAFSLSIYDAGNGSISIVNLETSSDTTNGMDGNWDFRYNISSLNAWYNASLTTLRQPWTVDWQNTKSIRLTITTGGSAFSGLYDCHIWGNYTRAGLVLWDASADQIMAGSNLDFGDTTQGSVYTRQLRIKNNYGLTANNIVIASPAGGVGDVRNALEFSDGGAYATSVTIPTIAPGAISPVVTVRRTVSPTAPLVIGCARVTATAGSWT